MFAEDLVDLMAEKGLVSPDLVKGLRSRLASTPKTVPAEVFANRLVEQGVLTSSLARALLRQLQPVPGQSSVPRGGPTILSPVAASFPPPPNPQPQQCPPAASAPSTVESEVSSPAAKQSVIALETPENPVNENKKKLFSTNKRRRDNQWDTKLILFGSAGLLVLLLLALFFGGSLVRRNADGMLSKANQEYEKAVYSQAILDYEDYLKAFPSHSGVPTAKIRLALSKIRLLVDSKSDWLKAYDTATQEIEKIESEQSFFDESKSELSVLLPRIASGLAQQAKEKESLFHAERAEQTLSMIERLLPRSLRPAEQISEISSQIREVRRIVFCDNALKETAETIESLLTQKDFDANRLAQCWEKIDSLLDIYPELKTNKRLIELLVRLSESEFRAARFLESNEHPQKQEQPKGGMPTKTIASNIRILATLYDRPKTGDISLPDPFPSVILCTKNNMYGLDSANGTPIWTRSIDSQNNSAFNRSAFPKSFQIFKTKTISEASFLLADEQQYRIVMLDARTGTELASYPIGERFFVSAVVQNDSESFIAATTQSGRLTVLSISTKSLKEKRSVQLPQAVDSAPVIISPDTKAEDTEPVVCQFAEHSTLYVIPIDDQRNLASFYIGQKPSTIRIPPVCLKDNLLVVRQTGIRNCELAAYHFSGPNRGKIRQIIPIRGLVDADMSISSPFLALLSDENEVFLFQAGDEQEPLRLLASGSAGGDSRKKGIAQYLALFDRTPWLADWQLMKFDFQPAQSRLLPGSSIRRNVTTLGPLIRERDFLFHTFFDPISMSFCMQTVSTDIHSVEWETELADSIIAEPSLESEQNSQRLAFYSAGGKVWTVEISDQANKSETQANGLNLALPVRFMPKGAFGQNILGNVFFLQDGYQLWVPDLSPSVIRTDNRKLLFYDPNAVENNRFRSIFLPASLASKPVLFNDHLLAPLLDGRIVSVNPQDGKNSAVPFAPLRPDSAESDWKSLLLLPDAKHFLAVDNRPDETGQALVYLVGLSTDENGLKFELKRTFFLENPIDSNLILFGTDRIAFVDQKNILRIVNTQEFDKAATGRQIERLNFERSESLSGKCSWGPFLFKETILCVDENSTMFAFSLQGNSISVESEIPVGKAFAIEDGIVLNTAQGKIWKIDPATLKTFFSMETGIQTKVGPFLIENRMILSGSDGIVYEADIPLTE